MEQDISREGLSNEKIRQLGRLFLPSNNRAVAKVSEFAVIDIEKINEELKTKIRGVILDIDECVAPHHREVLPKNVSAIIEMVRQGISIVVFSNMKANERYEPLIQEVKDATGYEIEVVMSRFAKPDARGFEECADMLGISRAKEILMIGDNFITDGGSIAVGIPFVKVRPIRTKGESVLMKIKRAPQIISRGFYSFISDVYDYCLRRKVLRDADFGGSLENLEERFDDAVQN